MSVIKSTSKDEGKDEHLPAPAPATGLMFLLRASKSDLHLSVGTIEHSLWPWKG